MDLLQFEGDDMRQILETVKQELGSDAVIISTKRVEAGWPFSRSRMEVTAVRGSDPGPRGGGHSGSSPTEPSEGVRRIRGNGYAGPSLSTEVDDDRRLIGTVSPSSEERKLGLRGAHGSESHRRSSTTFGVPPERTQSAADRERVLVRLLERADVEERMAAFLASRAAEETHGTETERLERVVADTLGELRWVANKRVMALAGPTGAGKTTTIAKIAATAALVHDQKVGLITLDTFRIGAVDQLRQYADLIGVPLHVARTERELLAAVERLKSVDLILIDTAGRSPGDRDQVSQLSISLEAVGAEIHLVIPASTRQLELSEISRRYAPLAPKACVFTKLDESVSLGTLLNVRGRPISFVTFGQRVPEDFAPFEPARYARELVRSIRPARPASIGGEEIVRC
ncbi:MAG: flagellar biosynthesis protein FlhF [Deltaproteobacteria bacterium]|nr:flagellar biosynthesis protein FlhF [Deltaproteobacteria bacterium]